MPHKTGAADEDMRHRGMVSALVAAQAIALVDSNGGGILVPPDRGQVTSSLGRSATATHANGGILMQ